MIYHEDTVIGNMIAETLRAKFESPNGLTEKQKKRFRNAKPKDSEFTVVAGIVALRESKREKDANVGAHWHRRKMWPRRTWGAQIYSE